MAPTHPNPGTQSDRVLSILKGRPICQSEVYRTDGITHRLAARIYDLRLMGWDISTERCRLHVHDSDMALYRLAQSDQMELPL